MDENVYNSEENALRLREARGMNLPNGLNKRDEKLLERLRPQNPQQINEGEGDKNQISKSNELNLLRRKGRTQSISKADLTKLEKAQKIIDFYNSTYWTLLNFSKWFFDILDLLAGFGTLISFPVNIYLIFRIFKFKWITKKGFNFYEYFCIIVEFIPVADLYPGMAELIKNFKKEAIKAKKQAETDLSDLQKKYPYLSLKS